MGRLFWKLFLFIWLGQMAAVAGTSALFWAERQGLVAHVDRPGPPPDGPPPPHHPGPYERPPGRPAMPPGPPGPPGVHLPVWAIVAGFLTSLGCAAGLAWYFAKPIRHLREGFARVAEGELAVRVSPGIGRRRDELADLGLDFDHMAARMQTLVDGQKRLLHDVSHEMRSPLARLQAAIGLARQQPERIDDILLRLERESDRMNRLIGELLTLSRLEAGNAGAVGPVEMGELLQGIVEDARFEGEDRQVSVDYVPGRMALVMADGELLQRAIENVVRNALRYAPSGSRVRIATGVDVAAGEAGRFCIVVQDSGPGVAEPELAAIFTPFHRGYAATPGDGYGLGLAIARQVVRGARGEIRAGNVEGGGFRVSIELPVEAMVP